MKPEDQRIAIAEACGYEKMPNAAGLMWNHKENRAVITPGTKVHEARLRMKMRCDPGKETLPDYLNDLNAMHSAEQTLRDQCLYWPDYIDELLTLCTNAYPHLPNEKLKPNWSATVGATAAQRAEAFLRALDKWTD